MLKLPSEYRNKEILYRRLILFTAALIMLIFYISKIFHIFAYICAICTPFFIGIVLAFILNVISNNILMLYKKTTRKKENRLVRFLANIGALVVFAALITLFLLLILPHTLDSFQRLMTTLPQGMEHLYASLLKQTEKVPYIHHWIENIGENIPDLSNVADNVFSWILSGGANDLFGSIYTIISTTFSWVITIFVALAFSIILLFNKRKFKKEYRTLCMAYLPKSSYAGFHHVMSLIAQTFTHYISGTCTECLILGTLVTCFSLIFHLPYSFLCGLVVGIGALVPMFGALCAAIMMTFFIAITSPLQAVYFIIMFLCIQNIEGNFIYPHVVGKFVEFPPMYVIVAVTIGANLAGVFGMVLSIPICSVLYQLVKEDAHKKILAKEKENIG